MLGMYWDFIQKTFGMSLMITMKTLFSMIGAMTRIVRKGGYKRWKVDYSVLPLKGELISDAFILQSADVGSAFRWSQAFLADKYPPETVREVVIWDIGMMNHNVFTKGNVDVILDIPADEEWRIHTLIDEQDLFVECATEESLEQGKIRVRLCGVKQHIDLLKSLFQE